MARRDWSEEDRRILNIRLDTIEHELEAMEQQAHGNYFLDELWNALEQARVAVNGDA